MSLTGLNDAAARAGRDRDELHVILVGRDAVADLNRRYLGREGATDVIAFALYDPDEPPFPAATYGELYVCLDVACAAARDCGTSVSHEVVLYAVHGMLHLVGFDDRTPADRTRMKAREREIMSRLQEKIGIGGIFATDPVV
jgi:probable rRNA maturation factor